MSVKLVRISGKVHRPLAIQAATDGVTISSIVERAIREELSRIKKEASRQKRIERKKSKANEVTATSDGSPAGARGPNSK